MPARAAMRLALSAAILLAGCGTSEKPAGLLAQAKAAQETAQKACEAQDAKAARAAATAATNACAALKTQSEAEGEDQAAAKEGLAEAQAAAAAAENWARLAEEEEQWREIVQGLRAKAYRAARGTAYVATLEALALASEQAAKYPPDQVPENLRPIAKAAHDLAAAFGEKLSESDGAPSPEATAKTLRKLKEQPPKMLSPYLAIALAMLGHSRMGLMEFDGFTSKEFKEESEARLFEAVLCRFHGLDRMADRALSEAKGHENARENEAALYVVIACFSAKEKDWSDADRYLAMAFRADPNNPLAVFLTGERLADDGKREEAAESLESVCKNLESDADRQLIAALRDRAREIRDAKGPPEGFLSDPALLYAVLRVALREQGKKEPAVKAVSDKLEAAHALAERIRAAIP